MKRTISILAAILLLGTSLLAQNKTEPWQISQLMAPKVLVDKINTGKTSDISWCVVGQI